MAEPTTRKRKRHRSPSYPSVDLKTAIEKARVIFEQERRSPAPVAVVAKHWGTNIKSSVGLRLIGALKQFGLIIEEGSGEDRHVRLSELALDILLAESETSTDRQRAIQQAAMAPRIHKTLWDRYGEEFPSHETLKAFLLRELEFHNAHVERFIKEFRATIRFAGLDGTEIVQGEEEDSANGGAADDTSMNETTEEPPMAAQEKNRDSDGPYIEFPLSGGNAVVIRLRRKVSPKDFERIRQLIELSESSLVDYEEQEEMDEPRTAALSSS